MITLYLLILINGQVVEMPTAKFHRPHVHEWHVHECLNAAAKNMSINKNTIWICK